MTVCVFAGYKGLICEIDVDECETEYICGEEGRCVNKEGDYECECPSGACGMYCALADPCAHGGPCVHGTCVSQCRLEPHFVCHCEPGFSGQLCNETMVSLMYLNQRVRTSPVRYPLPPRYLLGYSFYFLE